MYKRTNKEQEARDIAKPAKPRHADRGRRERGRETDPLNTLIEKGEEAKITGVARRVSPERFVSKSSEGGDDVPPRRLEKSAGLTLAIEDEHNHFASMLNRRMNRYCAEQDLSGDTPSNRFGAEADKWRERTTGQYEAEAVSNELHRLEQQGGRGQVHGVRPKPGTEVPSREVTAGAFSYEVYRAPAAQQPTGSNATTGRQNPPAPARPPVGVSSRTQSKEASTSSAGSSWATSTARVPPLAPVASSDPNVAVMSVPTVDPSELSRGPSHRGSVDLTRIKEEPSRTTHVHRRQPGREGTVLPSVGAGPSRLPPGQKEAMLRPQGTMSHRGSAPESCLQALAAIDRSDARSR